MNTGRNLHKIKFSSKKTTTFKSTKRMNKSKKAAAESRTENNLVKFEWLIWTIFAFNNWVLDFGRPIAMVLYSFFRHTTLFEI